MEPKRSLKEHVSTLGKMKTEAQTEARRRNAKAARDAKALKKAERMGANDASR